nr:protein Dr1 homolog isoform X2 [Ipomoea trifida]
MTEQALVVQQRMFAEAQARMNNGIIVPKQLDQPEQNTNNLL